LWTERNEYNYRQIQTISHSFLILWMVFVSF
jgi:hypothetical protein